MSVEHSPTDSPIPVTEVALVQRVNRQLTKEGQVLRLTTKRWVSDLGYYYILDPFTNAVVAYHVELEALAREMGVLRDGERLFQP